MNQKASLNGTEKVVFHGGPSQVVNFNTFTICTVMFLFAIFAPAFWDKFFNPLYAQHRELYITICKAFFFFPIMWGGTAWLKVRCHRYTVTTERLKEEEGIFSKETHELELFRVKDISYLQPFSLRMFGCGNIVLITSDRTTPLVIINAIKDGRKVLDDLRYNVQIMREQKGVREID
jgi:uncharacterized membrane protein YdbT with pleckstrin-like domain